MMSRIAVVTGSRAEYGLLSGIIRGIHEDPAYDLQLLVTGSHLAPEHGMTVRCIESDGLPIAERIPILVSGDTPEATSMAMGLACIGFAHAYARLQPDCLIVLGDRFEILAAVAAAAPFRIPIAHLHGGETTTGAMDDAFRHAITKLSHIHFAATAASGARIIAMGEEASRVYVVGAPGLDAIRQRRQMPRAALAAALGIPADRPWGMVTYHPETLAARDPARDAAEIIAALVSIPDVVWVCAGSNADPGGRAVAAAFAAFAAAHPDRARAIPSLGVQYLSFLAEAAIMVGNSSSGIIEAPSFELPVVNVGGRQDGRERAANVIDVPAVEHDVIATAIRRAFDIAFRSSLRGIVNPYGDGHATERILDILRHTPLGDAFTRKGGFDGARVSTPAPMHAVTR